MSVLINSHLSILSI